MIDDKLYWYSVEYCSNFDGDTVRCSLDLGCGIWLRNEPIRLRGIDCPEVRGEERSDGILAKEYVGNLLRNCHKIMANTYLDKKGKYGRLLADIYFQQTSNGPWIHLNALLVREGFAEEREY